MPETITGPEIVQMFREAIAKKMKLVEVSLVQTSDGNPRGVNIVGKDLRLRHKKSGLIYTVDAVGHSQFVLRTPEGEKFQVSKREMETEYELD